VAGIRPNDPGEGRPRKRKRRTTHETRPSREAGEVPTGTMAMAVALSHPLRVRIIYAMNSPARRCSATDMADETGIDVKRLSYHMRELATLGFIEQVDERPVRGSLEKIYGPVKALEAWEQEFKVMPPALKKTLAANVLGQGVKALGAAIDKGTFGARNDSVLGQDTFWADERGAKEALTLMDETMKALVEIREGAKDRLAADGEQGTLISYLLTGYEGSVRPV
jgi:hypothetical protein